MKDLKIIGLIAVLFILFDFLTGFWDGSKEDYSVFAVEKTSDLVGKLFFPTAQSKCIIPS